MNNPLRFAMVGCGNIAQRHAQHIAATGKLIAVCDVIERKAFELGKKYGANHYFSIEMMLESEKDIDVVVVCSPNGLHAEHSIVALQSGCHVLCEKPMAINSQDCAIMIETAKAAQKQLIVVKQNRYNPPVVALKRLLDENKLGRLYSLQMNCFWNRNAAYYLNTWRGTKKLDGGILFTQFSHFIDLLYWLIGDVEKVRGWKANYGHQSQIEFEDTGMALLGFKNGVKGTLHYTINSFGKNMEGSITLFGEKGTIKIGGEYLNTIEYQQIQDYVVENVEAGNSFNDYGGYQGSMSNHDKVYKNLMDVLTKNAPPTTTTQEALKTVEIIERIYAASTPKNLKTSEL